MGWWMDGWVDGWMDGWIDRWLEIEGEKKWKGKKQEKSDFKRGRFFIKKNNLKGVKEN